MDEVDYFLVSDALAFSKDSVLGLFSLTLDSLIYHDPRYQLKIRSIVGDIHNELSDRIYIPPTSLI